MTDEEVLSFLDNHSDTVFFRVFATPKCDRIITLYRFPGLEVTGYFVESAQHIVAWMDNLSIERIEVW